MVELWTFFNGVGLPFYFHDKAEYNDWRLQYKEWTNTDHWVDQEAELGRTKRLLTEFAKRPHTLSDFEMKQWICGVGILRRNKKIPRNPKNGWLVLPLTKIKLKVAYKGYSKTMTFDDKAAYETFRKECREITKMQMPSNEAEIQEIFDWMDKRVGDGEPMDVIDGRVWVLHVNILLHLKRLPKDIDNGWDLYQP